MSRSFTITETHETEKHKRTGHAARTKRRADNPAHTRYHTVPTRFVCIDGEGVTRPDGTHVYVLLGAGNIQISDPAGLSFEACLEFLWTRFLTEGTKAVAYTGFFLGYDFVQWLRHLPEERARMLLTAEGRAKRAPRSDKRVQPFPVRYGEWEFDILGNKRFRIRKAGSERWMSICDTGSFFQKSFLAVINPENWGDPVVTNEEYEVVSRGKSRRDTAELDDDMRYYNSLENEILSRVLSRLESGFAELGIHLKPNQWFGPGQAAQAWLSGRAITSGQLQVVTPSGVLEAAAASYYGGWFEIMAHGLISGVTYEYDINSAYPYIISQLPCLEHGEWTHENGPIQHAWNRGYTLVRAGIRGSDPHIGAMLHRDESGNISRPHETEGWYWASELYAATAAGLVKSYQVHEHWTYHPCLCPPPLAELAQLYDLRRKVGKDTPLGMAIKLVINSCYGKFAQSVGSPKFGNAVYASKITSGTREMILDAIASHPGGTNAVLMVATDGVYFSSPHPALEISGRLGDWDSNEKHNLCLFKPGVYWDDKAREAIRGGNSPVFKARGVNARDFAAHLGIVDDAFRDMAATRPSRVDWPEITFPLSFSMVSAVQALQRNNWASAGTLIPEPTATQSSNPVLKRCSWYWDDDILRSRPAVNNPYHPSTPYQKKFGMEDPWGQENQEENGITPDGLPGNLWREALYDD